MAVNLDQVREVIEDVIVLEAHGRVDVITGYWDFSKRMFLTHTAQLTGKPTVTGNIAPQIADKVHT